MWYKLYYCWCKSFQDYPAAESRSERGVCYGVESTPGAISPVGQRCFHRAALERPLLSVGSPLHRDSQYATPCSCTLAHIHPHAPDLDLRVSGCFSVALDSPLGWANPPTPPNTTTLLLRLMRWRSARRVLPRCARASSPAASFPRRPRMRLAAPPRAQPPAELRVIVRYYLIPHPPSNL